MKRIMVKDRPTRRVERVIFEDGTDVHEKRSLLSAYPLRRFAAMFGRDALSREARRLERARVLGVRVPEIVSLQREPSFGLPHAVVLVTRTFAGFRGVAPGEESDSDFAARFGAYLRDLHRRGVCHRDLHRGNLLFDPQPSGESSAFALLDGDRLKIVSVLSVAEKMENLLTVLRGFRGLRTRPAFAAFCDAYHLDDLNLSKPQLLLASESDLVRHHVRRSRRCLEENPQFGRVQRGGRAWQVRRDYLPPEEPARVFQDAAAKIKTGRSSSVAWLGADAVIKAFTPPRLRSRVADRFRGSRAQRAFRKGHLLELLQLRTPEVLAFHDGGLRSPSYLITRRVPDALQSTEFLKRETRKELRAHFVQSAGALVARLHRAGFSHRDLKGRNLLADSLGSAWVIDLDALSLRGGLSESRRQRDLARLHRSAMELSDAKRDYLRAFWRSYLATFQTVF